MKICIISGSPRKDSATLRVSLALDRILNSSSENEIAIIDFEDYDIPFLNRGSVTTNALTPWQKLLIDAMDSSQLIFVITPEYNWFPSAELINMVHQLGNPEFKYLFNDKVFSFVGVSSGRGGRMPAVQLGYVFDKLINVFNTNSVVSAKQFESQFTNKVLDVNGNSLGNAEYDKGLEDFANYSLKIAERWHK